MRGFADTKPAETLDIIFCRNGARDHNFYRKIDKHLAKIDLTTAQTTMSHEILGGSAKYANLLASNRIGRHVLCEVFVKKLIEDFISNEEYNYYFLTMINDSWNTSNLNTFIDLTDIERRSRRVIRRMGVDAALAIIEFQAMGRDEGSGVRTIFPNVHAVIRTRKSFKSRITAKKLSGSDVLKCARGADTVHITKRLKTAQDIARAVSYMCKAPASGKVELLTKRGPRFEETVAGMHQSVCIRLAEILSHFTFHELIFSTGEWSKLRSSIFADVHQSAEMVKSQCYLPDIKPAAFWATIPRIDPAVGCPVYIERVPHKAGANVPRPIPPRLTSAEKRQRRAIKARQRRKLEKRR